MNEWADLLKQEKAMYEQTMRENILECYIFASIDGETKSTEVGETPLHYPRFSLETYCFQEAR